MNNPLLPLVTLRAFRLPSTDIRYRLGDRFPNDRVVYISAGAGGLFIAVLNSVKGMFSVKKTLVRRMPVGAAAWTEVMADVRRVAGIKFGKVPVILSVMHGLEYYLKTNVDWPTQDDFVYHLRTEPSRVIGSPNEKIDYTGLLNESNATGLVLGVHRAELESAAEALTAAGALIVRRPIPSLSLLSLMLADERVKSGSLIPFIADQGFAISVPTSDGMWNEPQGRQFIGNQTSASDLADFVQQVSSHGRQANFLLHASPVNGGVSVDQVLTQAGAAVTEFSLGSIPNDNLLPYATALS